MIKSTRIETNIKDEESDDYLTFKIDLNTGKVDQQYNWMYILFISILFLFLSSLAYSHAE